MLKHLTFVLLVTCLVNGQNELDDLLLADLEDDFSLSSESREIEQCNLTGHWYNQHNSRILLHQHHNGMLSGEYKTAVESRPGAAGGSTKPIVGEVMQNLFSFHVFWNEGTSVTTWSGQCHTEGNVQLLKASWILTTAHNNCDEHWSANRFGQDTFHRKPMRLHRPHLKRS